ncbi:MAG: flagellin [Selenomonadaceae bacterium]|nr:flagellin [Selenomonadaceae bacterium]
MAMTILNNTAAQMTLGELNKNISRVGKDLKRIARGERLAGAEDGPSDYAISEKMRLRIRALGQNQRNVETGANLLKVAEGAIQNQLEIMRGIKEKVLNAANDSNTDLDRATIQKDIDQGLAEIENITQTTTYNNRRLLVGGEVIGETILAEWDEAGVEQRLLGQRVEWEVLDSTQELEESSLDIIPDTYQTLDGEEGPFAVFTPFQDAKSNIAVSPLGLTSSVYLSNGAAGTPNHVSLDLSSVSDISELDGAMFSLETPYSYYNNPYYNHYYILSTTPSARYNNATNNTVFGINYQSETSLNPNYHMIDISGCSTMADVAQKIKSSSYNYTYLTPTIDSENPANVIFETKSNYLSRDADVFKD